MANYEYCGGTDAEHILETIMHRTRWAAVDRDAIAHYLEHVNQREHKNRIEIQKRERERIKQAKAKAQEKAAAEEAKQLAGAV